METLGEEEENEGYEIVGEDGEIESSSDGYDYDGNNWDGLGLFHRVTF